MLRLRSTCIALAALASLSTAVAPARAADRVKVALLPLVVHATDGRDYLQRGLEDMLVSRLGRERGVAVLPIDDPSKATIDAAAAREVGAANEATWVIFGSFTHLADGASLDLSCAKVGDADATPRRIYVQSPNMATMISLLDGVADRAARIVLGGEGREPAADAAPGESPPPAEPSPVPAPTAPTPPAQSEDRDAGPVR